MPLLHQMFHIGYRPFDQVSPFLTHYKATACKFLAFDKGTETELAQLTANSIGPNYRESLDAGVLPLGISTINVSKTVCTRH